VRYGIEHSAGRTLVIMDADFNHRPEDIPRLLAALDTADVVVGSRYVPEGGMPDSRWRYASSWLLNVWIQWRTGSRIHDHTSGFLVLGRTLLRHLDLEATFVGYGDYCIRLLHQFQKHECHIAEVPVVYGLRKSGVSKTRLLGYVPRYLRTVEQIRASWR